MSSNNNNEVGTAAGIIGAGAALIAIGLFFVLAFAAFVLTILAICAWNKPLKLGRRTIEPEDARSFVRRGIVGAFLLPAFAAFMSVLFGIFINWDYLPHMLVLGYIAGSLGFEMLMADDETGAIVEPAAPPTSPAQTQRTLPRQEPGPFRYASWDDEEEKRG